MTERTIKIASSVSADDLLKVRKEKSLLQTALDEAKAKHKRDVESLRETNKKVSGELEAARRSHEADAKRNKELCDSQEVELKRLRVEVAKSSQVPFVLKFSPVCGR